ncbi:MAG: DNA mismatch repair endonuclease MutL [Prevotella sp.]|nr:DNA mismatch repair endonuclease MutL [Prevotella sp.]
MKTINILPPAIYNRLAAGEVVENPASIVKELLENALDAHAEHITVEIVKGGIDEIVVIDDGEGVAESELPKVFMPHATSKIKQVTDIDHIASLGFRGEALASIASVAKVTFTSKPAQQDYAVAINQDNEQEYTSGNRGTTVRVANLFYNTPARKKFLHSANVEKNHVTQVIHEIVFAHPNLHLRYYVDHQLLLDFRGQGLATAMQEIYQVDTAHLVAVKDQSEGLTVDGYISNLALSKVNKDRQLVIINGRVVNGGLIATVINEMMGNYLPMKEYPIFVLHFTVAPDRVDVNVHPQKREVRFDDRDNMIRFVRQAITKTMEDYFLTQISALTKPTAPTYQAVANDATSDEQNRRNASTVQQTADAVATSLPQPGHSFNPNQTETTTVVMQSLNLLDENVDTVKSAPNILNSLDFNPPITATQTSALSPDAFTILGQVFDTYLLVRTTDALLIIDQHAMAERMNYDRFCAEIDQRALQSQMLLTPLMMSVTPKEMTRFIELKPLLVNFGFDCDEFGENVIRVSAVPAMMVNASLKDFMTVLLNDKAAVNENLSQLIKHRVATAACKASIKAGDVLLPVQIETFLKNYFTTKNVPLCPHGRPIMLVYPQNKLETLFARK